jgi:hypothetical protein
VGRSLFEVDFILTNNAALSTTELTALQTAFLACENGYSKQSLQTTVHIDGERGISRTYKCRRIDELRSIVIGLIEMLISELHKYAFPIMIRSVGRHVLACFEQLTDASPS